MKKTRKFTRLFLLCLLIQASLWAQYSEAGEYSEQGEDYLSDLQGKTNSQKCDCEDYPDIVFNYDLRSALNAQILIRQMQEKKINEWKQRQNSVLKEEIEKQLGETFSSFAKAQSMFFRKLESENVTNNTHQVLRKYERSHSDKTKKHWKDLKNIKLLNFREREIHAGAIDNSQYGHLTYESTPLSEITTLEQLEIFKNQELASFGDNEWRMYEASEMRKAIEGILWLTFEDNYSYKDANEMYDALVKEQTDYYKSLDTWTQLDVMQWYLNDVKGPVTSSSGYYPIDFGTADYVEDHARKKKQDIPYEIRIFDPSYVSRIINGISKFEPYKERIIRMKMEAAKAAHIAKSLEAVSEEAMLLEACFESIGAENRKAVEANAGLQEAVTNYFIQNRYNKTSVDRILYLMTQHRTDQYYAPDPVYYTSYKCSSTLFYKGRKNPICPSGIDYPRFQDLDNQTLALEVLLNLEAREAGFRYFVEVLAALYAEDSYAGKKGYLLRNIFEANGISVPVGLSNETLEHYFIIGTGSDGSLTLAIFFKPGLGELLFFHGISLQEFLNEYWESMEETAKNDCGQGKVRDSNGNCVACLEKDLLGNCAKKITWVKDADNDNYYAAGSEREEYPTWKTASHFKKKSETLGEDCDDTKPEVHKNNKCQKCEPEPTNGKCKDCVDDNTNNQYDVNPRKGEISQEGFDLLKGIETLALQPYDDTNPNGGTLTEWNKHATIGYGHLIKSSEWNDYKNGITETEAEDLFTDDIDSQIASLRDMSGNLTQNQFDALAIFSYNIGGGIGGGFHNSSVRKMLEDCEDEASNYDALEAAWKAFNKQGGNVVPGLNNRRNAEWNIFVNGVYEQW